MQAPFRGGLLRHLILAVAVTVVGAALGEAVETKPAATGKFDSSGVSGT